MAQIQRTSKVRHKWTDKSRTVLVLLKRNYVRKSVTVIWNYIFRTRLLSEGFTHGIPPTSLDGQFQEIKRGGPGYSTYSQVTDATDEQVEVLFSDYCSEIRAATTALRTDLAEKNKTSVSTTSQTISRRRRVRAVPTTPPRPSNGNERTSASTSSRPSLQHFVYQASPYFTNEHENAQTRDWIDPPPVTQPRVSPVLTATTNAKGPRHPAVLFRATPEITAFRSRKYPDPTKAVPAPPVFGTKPFRDIVWPHLERAIYSSPFISFAQNPHNALRRVELIRSEDVEKKMFLVIFGFDDLLQDGQNQFGVPAGPYLVRGLFASQEVSDLPDGYKGAGEWISYGAITCEPIAILDSYQAINLAKALRKFKAGQTSALLQVHESLQPVPFEWKERIAQKFLNSYCGKSWVPAIGSSIYDRLMRVIFDGSANSLRTYEQEITMSTAGVHDDDDSEYFESEAESSWVVLPPSNEQSRNDVDDATTQSNERVTYGSLQSNWVTVERLNNMASDRHVALGSDDLSFQQTTFTPFWSPSPSRDPELRLPGATIQTQDEKCVTNNGIDDGWDSIDDLDYDFSQELGSAAARKITRATVVVPHCDVALPSIEWNPATDEFLASL